MMLEPEQNSSGNEQKPNSAVDHKIISSANRDKCIMTREELNRNSTPKSRSDTESIELADTRENPRYCATISRSIGKVVPASAADPSGISSRRRYESLNRC